MASFMPAACNPWAMDHAIERLLATPKTTAFRPCKSENMASPRNGKEYQPEAVLCHGCGRQRSEVRIQKEEARIEYCVSPRPCPPYSAATSSRTGSPTGRVAATNDRPYTQARITKANTRLNLWATAPTQRASTSCKAVPAK